MLCKTAHTAGGTTRIDPQLIAFRLPTLPEAVRTARLYVRAALCFQDLDHYADDAETITSELVSNVVQHVCGDGTDTMLVTLAYVRKPASLAIVVTDSSSHGPVKRELSEASEQGRGLQIIEELADHWGWDHSSSGKDVIVILSRDNDAAPQGEQRHSRNLPRHEAAVVGANIRILRQRKGWTQIRLAELMGWRNASTVCAAEGHRNGHQRGFTSTEIKHLAAIFGVSPRRLKTQCVNCNGAPPTGFACLACGATPDDHPPVPAVSGAPLHFVQTAASA